MPSLPRVWHSEVAYSESCLVDPIWTRLLREKAVHCGQVDLCTCVCVRACVCDGVAMSVPLVGRLALLAAGRLSPSGSGGRHCLLLGMNRLPWFALGWICLPWITLAVLMAALVRIKNFAGALSAGEHRRVCVCSNFPCSRRGQYH